MMTREELEAALDQLLVIANSATFEAVMTMRAAARKQLALMPQDCECVFKHPDELVSHRFLKVACHGSGKVYPPETVEKIADVITQGILLGDSYKGHAIRVLDALNGETP